ncbi:MAG: cell envelope biogenesis protein TolA, partial [Paracoccaceae bacterium]
MYTGQIISGAGHGVLILWLLLGDFLFSPPEPEELAVVSGELISSADFEAMQAAARANATTAPEPVVEEPPPEPVVEPPEPVVEEPPEPVVEEPPPEPVVEEPPPEPVVEEPPPEPEEIPEGTTGFAEPSVLPPSDDPQPLPNPLEDARPRQRPSDIVAAVPVEETPDVEVSDTPTPAVSEEATDEPVVEQEPVEETAPEAASTEIIPEQPEEIE